MKENEETKTTVGRADFEERKEARIDRLNARAEKASRESQTSEERAHNIGRRFEMGQPIIVGHHSEKGARADQKRMDESMRRSVDAQKKAEYYSKKAKIAENNTAISSDDPECVTKLQEKIDALKAQQEMMKAVNKYYRKHKTCVGCECISEDKARSIDASMKEAESWVTAPYASFTLTNLNARIKDAEKRLVSIENVGAMPEERFEFEGGVIESDPAANRVKILFEERPAKEVTQALKSNGFKWAPSEGCWQRLRNPAALRAAKAVCNIR